MKDVLAATVVVVTENPDATSKTHVEEKKIIFKISLISFSFTLFVPTHQMYIPTLFCTVIQKQKRKKNQVEGPFYKDASASHLNHLRGGCYNPASSSVRAIMYQTSHSKLYITNQSYFSSLRERYNKYF